MTGLSAWTGGFVGDRDPAQPLLTLHDGPARVELSGATTANWVAKSANLLVDGLGGPSRVGLLLPLHWQTVTLLLAGVTARATVVVATDVADLSGCDVAFTTPEHAASALDEGVDDVLALSGHPLGAPCGALPPMVQDFAREVPSYGDGWSGPAPTSLRVEAGGEPVTAAAYDGVTTQDRVLLTAPSLTREVVAALAGVLRAGAALVLLPDPRSVDVAAVAAQERVTATYGLALAPHRRLD